MRRVVLALIYLTVPFAAVQVVGDAADARLPAAASAMVAEAGSGPALPAPAAP